MRFQPSGFSSDLLQGHTKQEDRQQQEEERWGSGGGDRKDRAIIYKGEDYFF